VFAHTGMMPLGMGLVPVSILVYMYFTFFFSYHLPNISTVWQKIKCKVYLVTVWYACFSMCE